MITETQFWSIMGLLLTTIIGVFTWALWVAREIASLKVTARNNRDLITMSDKSHKEELLHEVQNRDQIVRDLHSVNTRIFERLDTIVGITSEIKVTCGRHDERLKKLEIST